MTVNANKLVRMAEQISLNITVETSPTIRAAKLADHLQRFWDPRMREVFIEYANEHPDALTEVLRDAAATLASDAA